MKWEMTEPGVWEADITRTHNVKLEAFAHDDDDPDRYSWFAIDFTTGRALASGEATGIENAKKACEAAV